jgi:hypothetical protein
MKKFLILAAALSPLFAGPALAQTPPSDSVTLNWTNPPTYQSGQPLTVGQVSIFIDGVQAAQSGAINTFTTTVLPPGTHTFNVVICDNMTPANCSPMSNTATVTIAPVTLVVPAVSNLTAVVNP